MNKGEAMSSVETVHDRLEGALAKLESAIDERVRSEGERVRALTAEVSQLRTENARLQRISDQIAGRLEAAISRLKTVLES